MFKNPNRTDKRKYHFIYKTTCLINSRWYIGMHSTDLIEDGYLGSGTLLWKSINKYGVDNHTREIVEFCIDRKTLAAREKEIVNEDMLKEELCLNLTYGGAGGHIIQSTTKEARVKAVKTAKANGHVFTWAGRSAMAAEKGTLFTLGMLGKKHSLETRQILSSLKSGEGNNQFGKRVFFNPNDLTERVIVYPDQKPTGWLDVNEKSDMILIAAREMMNKNHSSYGRSWFNDGERSFLLHPENSDGLIKGRLSKPFKRIIDDDK